MKYPHSYMKTVQINAVYGEKSTGLVVKDINDMLRANGIETFVGYQKSNAHVPGGIKIGMLYDWKFHAAYTRLTGLQGYASKCATKKFLTQLKLINPDVIHLHNLHANFINLPMLLSYCSKEKIKTLLTLHDCWFFTGKCYHFDDIKCEKYKTGCNNCPKKLKDIPNYFSDNSSLVWNDRKRYFKSIDKLKVVGCSDWISEKARQTEIFENRQVLTIRNGVDCSVFYLRNRRLRGKFGIEQSFVLLVMANKWFNEANTDARRELLRLIDENTVLCIVGCNESQIEQYRNIKNIITFGYIKDREAIAEIYSMADVFLNLSIIDNLPTVTMESICCGTPVVCYDQSGGGPELILEGKTGFVIPMFDTNEMVKKIRFLRDGIIDRKSCAEIGKSCFSKDIVYKRYYEEYMEW